jgi:3-carboxy-cis,cis-muconate cycloisomerase
MHQRMAGTAAMIAVFDDRATLAAMLRFEAELARAQAEVGLIPADAAEAVAAACDPDGFDPDALAEAGAHAGTLAIPLVEAIRARAGAAAASVHLGATSQDVADTALVLQLRDGTDLLRAELRRLARALAVLAREHADTLMTGRTLLQPGAPTTLGLQAASWLLGVEDADARLAREARDALVLQLGGAVGTLAALGDRGPAVAEALARRLDLPCPPMPWHVRRGAFAGLAAAVAIAVGAGAKVARDVSLLMQAEVGEAAEPGGTGRGGSSAMPHKRNPAASVQALTAHARAPQLAATLLGTLAPEHQRGLASWQADAATCAPLWEAAHLAAAAAAEIAEGLRVDAAAMARNLETLRAVAGGSGPAAGVGAAHVFVDRALAVHRDAERARGG